MSQTLVSGRAATMTVVAMGLGYSITAADPTTLSATWQRSGAVWTTPATASFLASLCTLTLAAVLGAGALGDLGRYEVDARYRLLRVDRLRCARRRGAARLGADRRPGRSRGGFFAFVLGLSLAIINAVFSPGRRAVAIAAYLGAGHALAVFQPAPGRLATPLESWRTCLRHSRCWPR